MADTEDSDDGHGIPAPHTPPPPRRARPESFHRDGSDASPANLSPPASPSMSLSSLGMSPLSPLRRQFSPASLAPSSPLYPQSESDHLGPDHGDHETTTQGSRDALVQRLNDLAGRLSRQDLIEDESIHVLQAKVNELENVLSTPGHAPKTKTKTRRPRRRDGRDFYSEPLHPDNMLPSDVSSLASSTQPSPFVKTRVRRRVEAKADASTSNMTVAQAEKVIAEAQGLYKNLEVVISNLRDRQEETEATYPRAPHYTARTERERKESDAELLQLQIQLKAIEVQCLSYVPQDADQELRESIDTWKMEWSALKQKKARNRERHGDTPTRRRAAPPAE
ncbi:hypothetical protein ONZ43_g7657 [Nemania bipapillata]|uniref:Uncharacterized protein n=1 Tax=Nemania bipapillata TaxID=110536 RepID=A0ACC2HPV2_9PEZI|nr:hypothetical protein ONZ43_g7657 [Nemania bipapillata]